MSVGLHSLTSTREVLMMARKNSKSKAKAKTQMDFGERLAALGKEKGLTQQALAELINVHVIQVRRYEATSLNQPWT